MNEKQLPRANPFIHLTVNGALRASSHHVMEFVTRNEARR